MRGESADLVDVELGECCVEHQVEVVEHRDDLHRRAFTGQRRERHHHPSLPFPPSSPYLLSYLTLWILPGELGPAVD